MNSSREILADRLNSISVYGVVPNMFQKVGLWDRDWTKVLVRGYAG